MWKTWLSCLALFLPVLTGCLSHTHKLQQPKILGAVLNADAVQLITGINQRYDKVHSLTATVYFLASVGGARVGKQTDYTSIRGYILFRKPAMLRVVGLVPVLSTRAFDLASNGSTFTLLIPPKERAIVGSSSVTTPAANPLENLRPAIFLNSILVHSIAPDRIVSVTNDMHTSQDLKSKQLIEQPDYDLAILGSLTAAGSPAVAEIAKPLRVIHISRSNLLPTEQDFYNEAGDLETRVSYGPYQNFNGAQFPSSIEINRPLQEYRIRLTVEKLVINPPLADDQFQLKIPQGIVVEKLQ